MNAQYFTEIALGTPPQIVSNPASLPFLDSSTHSSKSSSILGSSRPSWKAFIAHTALDQATFGSQAWRVHPLLASSTPSMTRKLPQLTKPMAPSSRFSTDLVPWRVLFQTTCSPLETWQSKNKILLRPPRNRVLLLHLESELPIILFRTVVTLILGSMVFWVLLSIQSLSTTSHHLSITWLTKGFLMPQFSPSALALRTQRTVVRLSSVALTPQPIKAR